MSGWVLLILIPLACVLPGVVAVLYGRGLWVIVTIFLSALALVFLPFEILLAGPGLVALVVLLVLAALSAGNAVAEQQHFDQARGVPRSPLGAFTLALRSVRVVATGAFCLALMAAAIEACVWLSEPPIIRDILGGLFIRSPLKNGKEVYEQRVQTMFPTKIPEAEMLALLSRQGYKISKAQNDGRRYAGISSSLGIVCKTTWGVTWRVDNAGLVSEVKASEYSACL